jgi:dynein heavy chain
VNCTTIDWFSEWPPDALEAVAEKFLGDIEMDAVVRKSCVQMVQIFHTTTEKAARRFQDELRRIYYVTPTSYLELISTFKTLLAEKRTEVAALRDRYSNGYDCLIGTESKVNVMQKELEDLQPILVETGKETEEQLIVVTRESEAAEKVKASVAVEEADA